MKRSGAATVSVLRYSAGRAVPALDTVATEEPLEIRIVVEGKGGRRQAHSVAVTMRTPGNDDELAAGFLFTEGLIASRDEVARVSEDLEPGVALPVWRIRDESAANDEDNVVHVYLKAGSTFNPQMLTRNFYITSSCGVCGKASLNALRIRGIDPLSASDFRVSATILLGLGDSLRGSQTLFKRTGGLHAAALFDAQGSLLDLREDVGRHNAMDKLLGRRLLDGAIPLDHYIAFLSGRASWELMQKALVARIPMVVAVGAPSSLAIDLARDFNITLAGFARDGQFNVYAGAERIDFAS